MHIRYGLAIRTLGAVSIFFSVIGTSPAQSGGPAPTGTIVGSVVDAQSLEVASTGLSTLLQDALRRKRRVRAGPGASAFQAASMDFQPAVRD